MEEQTGAVILDDQEWAAAKAIARELAPNVDRNELGKAISYFQRTRSRARFFELLDRLPRSGYTRSRQTNAYLKRIAETCRRHLGPISDDRHALAVVSWSFRLMTYSQTKTGQRSDQGRQRRERR